jgi:hypothetical protein
MACGTVLYPIDELGWPLCKPRGYRIYGRIELLSCGVIVKVHLIQILLAFALVDRVFFRTAGFMVPAAVEVDRGTDR